MQQDIARIKAEFKKGNPRSYGKLMSAMERIFAIPLLENETYNHTHKEVMELYKEIANAREF